MNGSLNKAPSATHAQACGLDWLITETERRLDRIIERLNSTDLSGKEERLFTDAYTKLAGTLQKLYALKGIEPPEEENLATLLSKIPADTFKEALQDTEVQKTAKKFLKTLDAKLKKSPKQTKTTISTTLQKIHPGDFIETTWIDASQSKGVDIRKPSLPNHSVETRKVTKASYLRIQRGETWRDEHLLLSFEETDGLHEIISIPLTLVKTIRYANEKHSRKTKKPKEKQRFTDGSTKIFGG